jgi:hypothetical protein
LSLVVALIGVASLIGSCYGYFAQRNFLAHAEHTMGKIVGFNQTVRGSGKYQHT